MAIAVFALLLLGGVATLVVVMRRGSAGIVLLPAPGATNTVDGSENSSGAPATGDESVRETPSETTAKPAVQKPPSIELR